MYDDYNTIYVPEGYGKIRFSKIEIKHILIASIVLTFAFAITFNDGLGHFLLSTFLVNLGAAAVAVLAGFLLHELGHKLVAQRYGAWAEFRMYPLGLVLALLMSFMGFLFAAPGAVYISGRVTKRQNGLISLAGPLVNLAIGSIFLISWIALGSTNSILELIAFISFFLAAFNLIPLPPLDGYKIVTWNIPAYVGTVILTGIGLAILYGIIRI